MAFYPYAYSTLQYRVAAIGNSATMLPPGTVVTVTRLPIGPSGTDIYFEVGAATSTDTVFGVVALDSASISSASPGKIVTMNAGMIPVLLSANQSKDDLIKVQATAGKMEAIAAGEVAEAKLMENGTMGNLAWAKPVHYKP